MACFMWSGTEHSTNDRAIKALALIATMLSTETVHGCCERHITTALSKAFACTRISEGIYRFTGKSIERVASVASCVSRLMSSFFGQWRNESSRTRTDSTGSGLPPGKRGGDGAEPVSGLKLSFCIQSAIAVGSARLHRGVSVATAGAVGCGPLLACALAKVWAGHQSAR